MTTTTILLRKPSAPARTPDVACFPQGYEDTSFTSIERSRIVFFPPSQALTVLPVVGGPEGRAAPHLRDGDGVAGVAQEGHVQGGEGGAVR